MEHTHLLGSTLPDLTLDVFHQNAISKRRLSSFRSSWLVLFFYPADFTFVCPTELKEMAGLYSEFQSAGAEVVSVSTDTAFVHKAWFDHSPAIGTVRFPMAADPTGALCRALGTYIEEDGLSYRASFIVDPDGVIKAYEMHDNSIGRSASELLRKLKAAQYVREHGGQVCPANWQPGDATLTPGVDLVGKI
jgi:NADH-dependent peroxiredoxin subunit C